MAVATASSKHLNGWLQSRPTDRPNARKNYRITGAGRRLLDQLREDLNELHREVVLGIEPAHASRARRPAVRVTAARRARRGEVTR